MNYITLDQIKYRLKYILSLSDTEFQIKSLLKLLDDVKNSSSIIGPFTSFITDSIYLLIDMISNDKCIYVRNDIFYTFEKISNIITHMILR